MSLLKLSFGLFFVLLVNDVRCGQLRRIWMQDHCRNGVCSGIEIGRNDYVIMSQEPFEKQTMFNFVNSSIRKIPHLMFDTFPDLQILRMENCSVETFENPQFEGASNLMSLFLGQNLLKEIPKNIFLGADNLNTLFINNNQLKILNNQSFNALKELKKLSLENNQLNILPSGIFAHMNNLFDLNLAGNLLELFPRNIFEKNVNLKRISLARNRFKVFESELFKTQTHLSFLDLSGNIMQDLTLNLPILDSVVVNDCDLRKLNVYGIVKELELRNNSLREIPHIPNALNLTSLDLSLNPLGSLQGHPFRRYTNLLRLNLSSTNMHEISEGVFKKQSQLKLLDISSNSLFNVKFIVFDNLKNLQYFHFQQNNWNCDFLQLLMNSFVKKLNISFMEDSVAPELVDDYVDGIACWYEYNKNPKKCDDGSISDAALELAIVRNDIKQMMETMEKKFVKVYRLLEDMKIRL
ncbi:leucine-rich repeat-containing protein 15 [Lucilia cuprina]|uniref:leucine-rich repeat-containing protein 15 n=1 Tax=Lucilia cuprina TaxID=7375 RepID=UPI000C71BBB0|nr:leucine-rich repeat-containing protein 15 [Lucilia cuprina]